MNQYYWLQNKLGEQLPVWYQTSTANRMIPPDVQSMFAERMNATTGEIHDYKK